MAPSPAASLRPSPAASSSSSSVLDHRMHDRPESPSIPIDALVNHLLAAKRSLSSMTRVLHANELAEAGRSSREDGAILTAQVCFLRSSILDQTAILARVRRSLQGAYDWGANDFSKLVKAMDDVDADLGRTMDMLRNTEVQSALRPEGESPKNLLDFVDETSVYGMREAMKRSIQQLQGIQQSFDGDLLRFDTEVRDLKKIMSESRLPQLHRGEEESERQRSTADLLSSLIDHSSNMAQLLTSLNKHFDMCVTAIRTTEGAAALARRKAAEVTQSQGGDGVSISGVIAEQESNLSALEPETAEDRAEMLRVVVQDAKEVDEVVQEICERHAAMEHEYRMIEERAEETRRAYMGMLQAYAMLCDLGDRLSDYVAAEDDFKTRWMLEEDIVFAKLREMKQMRDFYEGYASAYDSLILEVERRRGVDERVASIWRKAQDNVDKILDADRVARETFRSDVGEWLPTDLWAGVKGLVTRWKVVPVHEEDPKGGYAAGSQGASGSKTVSDAAD